MPLRLEAAPDCLRRLEDHPQLPAEAPTVLVVELRVWAGKKLSPENSLLPTKNIFNIYQFQTEERTSPPPWRRETMHGNENSFVTLFDPRKKLHVYLIDLLGQIPQLGGILQGHGAGTVFAKKTQKHLF